MPILPTGIAQSLGGAPQAERAATKPIARRETAKAVARRRAEDELIVGADAVDGAEGIRRVQSNEQEESREEREARSGYTPGGKAHGEPPPRLDIAG